MASESALAPQLGGWRALLRNRNVQLGLILIGILAAVAVLAPFLPIHDPDRQFPDGLDSQGMPVPPSSEFWLGTDSLGRDVFSRLCYGSRVSLTVGTVAMLTATLIGAFIGLLAGYSWRWIDQLLMRFTDIMLALPAMLLAIALAGIIAANKEPPPLPSTRRPRKKATPSRLRPLVPAPPGLVHADHGDCHRQLDRHGPGRLRPGADHQAARLHSCGAGHRLLAGPDPVSPHPAERAADHHRTGHIEHSRHHRPGSGTQLPGHRHRAANAVLGRHDQRRPGLPHGMPWLALPPGIAVVLAVLAFNLLGQGLQDVLDPYQKRNA